MDKKMRHIADIAETKAQDKGQMSASLYWISRLATDDFEEVIGDQEYGEHLDGLDIDICLCGITFRSDKMLCEDCLAAEEEMWRDHQEEVGDAHLVGVGRG